MDALDGMDAVDRMRPGSGPGRPAGTKRGHSRRKDFTLPQLFACLVLREHQKKSYLGVEALLEDSPSWRSAMGLIRTPDSNTLWRAFQHLVQPGRINRMLDQMAVWAQRHRMILERMKPVALDSTMFESRHVSRHFEKRQKQTACQNRRKTVQSQANRRRRAVHKRLPKLSLAVASASHLILAARATTGSGGDQPFFNFFGRSLSEQTAAGGKSRMSPFSFVVCRPAKPALKSFDVCAACMYSSRFKKIEAEALLEPPMNSSKIVAEGITFDDVLLIPGKSDFVPNQADTSTKLSKNIAINIPLVSAAMDTVTEAALAIALAQEGGIGIIHKNLSIEAQTREVYKVKRSENGVIIDPVTLTPEEPVRRAQELMSEQNVSGIPIVEGKKLVGILTRRDLKFLQDQCRDQLRS